MTALKVVEWPAKVLETPAKEVEVFDDQLRTFVADMFETMHAEKGIGLAANQVDVLKRVLVIEIPFYDRPQDAEVATLDEPTVREWWHDKRFAFINPKIVVEKGKTKYMEGCLSFPEVYEYIERSETIKVAAQDEYGKHFEVEANGLFAICLQHEIDHIDGIPFIKRMSRLKSASVMKQLQRKFVTTS